MNYRYSDLSIEQLYALVGEFKEKAQKAEQLGNISEVQIYERKMQVALSYTLNPEDFTPGRTYEFRNDPGHRFKINYLEGIFAWGHRVNLLDEVYEKEEAFPISLLGKRLND
ncbi:YfhH family protein [Ornithinibacillus halotolerans]|uniref:DUF1811 family protein n=1 Tax=Ornithinibacillus halotolerans TaxID=1274357 RepID=A0A916S8Q1_9BACI|nr:YfhH family protein [Ornithinibacillus halotolerans]GGA89277.1 hypothetical protein GCM10008025_34880 [Ornithinibacillus halotolerans]